jgi:LPS export ABC transporter protein LptC
MQFEIRQVKFRIYFATLFIFLVALAFFASCENDIQKVNELATQSDSALIKAKSIEMTYSLSGIVKVRMSAPELKQFENEPGKTLIEFPSGMNMIFYDSTGTVISRMKAKYSIYYEQKGLWEARNDVEVENQKGEKLNTEYLVWDRNKEKITSDQFVKMTTLDGIIYGDGFESDQSFSDYEVINPRGLINVDNE